MLLRIISLLLLIQYCLPQISFSQQKVIGQIVNIDAEPLAFASIVYLSSKKGTSANADGYFNIEFNDQDTLLISMVGFLSKKIVVYSSVDTIRCILEKDYSLLNTLEIRSTTTKNKNSNSIMVGHYKKPFTFFSALASDLQEATFIPNDRNVKGILKEIEFSLKAFQKSNYIIRLRILDLDTLTGLPGIDLLLHDNLIFPDKFKKNMKISLESKNIQFSQYGLFISLEFLPINRSQKSKTPWIMGNQNLEVNHSYVNYKNLGWEPNLLRSPTSGKFLTHSIGLSIKLID